MKLLKRLFIVTLVLLLSVVGASFIIAHYYEDEVKAFVIAKVNERLDAKITVDDISLSLLPKFPQASLDFQQIWAKENIVKMGELDTLFYFDHAYLQFNVIDLIQGDYTIREISLEDGFARFRVDKDGYDNYQILKPAADTTSSDFLLALEDVSVERVHFSFTNELKQDEIVLYGDDVNMSGQFSNELFAMDVEGDVIAENIVLNRTTYMADRRLDIETQLDIDKPNRKYAITDGHMRVDGEMNFDLAGTITDQADATDLQLDIKSNNLDIPSGIALLPEEYRKQLALYDSKGILQFNCQLSGALGKRATPLVSATFKVDNGTLTTAGSKYVLEQVKLNGKYSNGAARSLTSSSFVVDHFSAKLGDGSLQSTCTWKNFRKPVVQLDATADLSMEQWLDFFPSDTIESASGNLALNLRWEGQLTNLDSLTATDLIESKTAGTATLNNVNIAVKDMGLAFQSLTGKLGFHNNNVVVESLSGTAGSSDFELDGLFKNMLPWLLLPDEPLTVEARLKSNSLNLDELLASNTSDAEDEEALVLPEKLRFNMNLDVAHVQFRRFEAHNLRGVTQLSQGRFSASALSFDAMDGHVLGSITLDDRKGIYAVGSKIDATGIDVQKLFYTFDNFTQNVITERHLQGTASTSIDFRGLMTPNLTLDENSIVAQADLSIKDGELIGLESLKDITDFLGGHKVLNKLIRVEKLEEKLEHIVFTELTNSISVRNKTVTIPEMSILSSAVRMDLAGKHTFDNHIDYEMEFFLADFLKRENISSDLTQLPEDSKGRSRVIVLMSGTVDDPHFEYKTSDLLAGVKDGIKKETNTVKGILKDEYGLFKGDSTIAAVPERKPEQLFDIEWTDGDEEPKSGPENRAITADNSRPPGQGKQRESRNFRDVLNRVTQPEQPKSTEEFDFGDDDF